MKKKSFTLFVVSAMLLFSHVTFASDEQTVIEDLNQQLIQELSNDDLLAATQDYLLEQTIRPQSRRSALFAHILDTMAKNATLAKLDKASATLNT